MRGHGLRNQLGQARRAHRLQQLLPVQRLHFRRRIVDHVDFVPPGARFGQHALQDTILPRAPEIDLDAMTALELSSQTAQILLRHRRVHVDHWLRACAAAEHGKHQQQRSAPHRSCVMVSMSAGWFPFTRLMARFNAPRISLGPCTGDCRCTAPSAGSSCRCVALMQSCNVLGQKAGASSTLCRSPRSNRRSVRRSWRSLWVASTCPPSRSNL